MNLKRMIFERLLLGSLTLLGVSAIIFIGADLLPGDAATAMLGQSATPETLANLREELGLNRFVLTRYFEWLGNFLQFDFGTSLVGGMPISDVLLPRLENTLLLSAFAAVVAVPLAVVLGVLSAIAQGKLLDKCTGTLSLFSISVPEFLTGYVLVYFLSITMGWLPSMTMFYDGMPFAEKMTMLILPVITLVMAVLAHMMRMTRVTIINVLSQPYIEMAYLNGNTRTNVILKHALPNIVAPIINIIALNLAYLIVGVVVVEVVFVYPGMGQLMIDSVAKRDLPVVQACAMIFASVYIVLNLVSDIFSIVSNPKIRYPK